jgi:hypothetical protein
MNPNLLLSPFPQTPSGKGVSSGGSGGGGGGGGGINSNIIAQLQKDVDPIAFLNQSFPTEESLDNLEEFVKTVSDQVSTLDQVGIYIILLIYHRNELSAFSAYSTPIREYYLLHNNQSNLFPHPSARLYINPIHTFIELCIRK